jgi:cardiolipin synthase
MRDFSPSIFGKANTLAQVGTVVFVMLFEIHRTRWVYILRWAGLRATFAFTIISALHYIYLVGVRLRTHNHAPTAMHAPGS